VNRKTLLIIAGAVVGVCMCCAVVVAVVSLTGVLGIFGVTQPVADVGEKFMQSLKAGDYATAYAQLHPALQQKIGTPQDLKKMVESGKAQPSKWNFTTRNMENDQGHLEGSVTMQGAEGTVTLDLTKLGDEWKITSFNLTPK
jgi:hypothetical protein